PTASRGSYHLLEKSCGYLRIGSKQCENLKELLETHVDMQFKDVRTMLMLPQEPCGLSAGCNLAITSILCNIIAGLSRCVFEADKLGQRGIDRAQFTGLLTEFYPWQDEPLLKKDGVEILYEHTRNPLTHAFGLREKPENKILVIDKSPLTYDQIIALEEPPDMNHPLTPTLKQHPDGIHINVATLYWGVHRMLQKLFSSIHVVEAEKKAKELLAIN
ncbi:MAG: hypothetical protein V2A77_05220, partial [Pseudomonadota bacterium]